MCWISRELNKQVATKNITIYKVGTCNTRSFISLYTKFRYQYNKVYTESFTIGKYPPNFHITTGFHSYKTISKASRASIFFCKPIAWCTIPKGAVYYENNDGEIVSNQIIINGFLQINLK